MSLLCPISSIHDIKYQQHRSDQCRAESPSVTVVSVNPCSLLTLLPLTLGCRRVRVRCDRAKVFCVGLSVLLGQVATWQIDLETVMVGAAGDGG